MHKQEAPLIQLGPNSSYGTAFYGHMSRKNNKKQARLIAVVGGTMHGHTPKNYQPRAKTFLDRLLGIDRFQNTPAVAASNTWNFAQEVKTKIPRQESPIQMISMYLRNMSKLGTKYVTQLSLFPKNQIKEEQPHEFNPKATRSARIDQAASRPTRIFANDERIIIGTRREQSNRLRANRSTHPQRRSPSSSKQSSLFINC